MQNTLVGHEMLNHLGERICVTAHTLRSLDSRHYLRRDQETGLLQINPDLYPAFLEIEGGDHRAKFFREIGADCKGPNVAKCKCRECQAKMADGDHTRLPGRNRLEQDEASKIVREIKARRRVAA
jgi:hypothetical protein